MKTFLRLRWIASAVVLGLGGIGYAVEPLVAVSAQTPSRAKNLLLPVGTPRDYFLLHVGQPDAWLSADVAVYWNWRTNQPEITQGYDSMLVEFGQNRVTALRMVPSAPVREYLAKRDHRSPAALLATTSSPVRTKTK